MVGSATAQTKEGDADSMRVGGVGAPVTIGIDWTIWCIIREPLGTSSLTEVGAGADAE
jgi:hypothetical protein